jgi:hypothetical protein
MTAEAIQQHGGRVSLTTLKRELAAAIWQPGLRGLREKGCVRTVYDLAPPSPPPRAEPWVELSASPEALEAFFQADALRAPAQARLLMHLLEHPDGRLPRRALLEATGASLQTLRMLESRGLTRQTHAAAESLAPAAPPPTLTPAQQYAVNAPARCAYARRVSGIPALRRHGAAARRRSTCVPPPSVCAQGGACCSSRPKSRSPRN